MKILLIGCGKMGSAILGGWLSSGISLSQITIIDPVYKGEIEGYDTLADLPENYAPDYVLLAVKPQNLDEVAPQLARFSKATMISIVAGKKIAYFKKYLPNFVVIRTMPNLPALIGKGITAAVASEELGKEEKERVERLLKPCGKLVWLDNEELIDSVTAISGSGPAYVFLFADSMVEAAVELGLDAETAKALVFETIKGSIDLAEISGDNLATLKQNVTSKGGTTEAALAVLEDKDILRTLVKQAIKQAKKRALELS